MAIMTLVLGSVWMGVAAVAAPTPVWDSSRLQTGIVAPAGLRAVTDRPLLLAGRPDRCDLPDAASAAPRAAGPALCPESRARATGTG